MSIERPCHFAHLLQVKKKSLKSDFIHIFACFIHVYSHGAGADNPLGSELLHVKVRLPILLSAVKTVEGDFRFCWTTPPNVGQTHKENPN